MQKGDRVQIVNVTNENFGKEGIVLSYEVNADPMFRGVEVGLVQSEKVVHCFPCELTRISRTEEEIARHARFAAMTHEEMYAWIDRK